jgi:hypothetical protein
MSRHFSYLCASVAIFPFRFSQSHLSWDFFLDYKHFKICRLAGIAIAWPRLVCIDRMLFKGQ